MDWLRTNVYGLGSKMLVQDLLKGATGKPLSATSFIRYVEAKYLESAEAAPLPRYALPRLASQDAKPVD